MFDGEELVLSSGAIIPIPVGEELPLPSELTWGCATAAYQIEGGSSADGKGVSVWDTLSHQEPSPTNGENADVACDNYHQLLDVDLLAEYGVEEYRFSIAWTRLVPLGVARTRSMRLALSFTLVD
jgi:beta-glucosidase